MRCSELHYSPGHLFFYILGGEHMKSDEVASVFLGLQLDMDGLKSQINNLNLIGNDIKNKKN